MGNPEDEGRFLKDIFRGVPTGYGLTRSEQSLRELAQISRGLSSLREGLPAYTGREPAAPISPAPSALVQVNVPDSSAALEPHMRDIVAAQEGTNAGIEDLTRQGQEGLVVQRAIAADAARQTDQGESALEQRETLIRRGELANRRLREIAGSSRLAVTVLESLDEHGRNAYVQRLALLGAVYGTREAIASVDIHLQEGVDRVDTHLFGLEKVGQINLAELKAHTALLDDIARLEGEQIFEIQSIDRGIKDLTLVAREEVHQLQNIGSGVSRVETGVRDLAATAHIHTGILERQASAMQGLVVLESLGLQESLLQTRALEGIAVGIHKVDDKVGQLVERTAEQTHAIMEGFSALASIGHTTNLLLMDLCNLVNEKMDMVILSIDAVRRTLENVLDTLQHPARTKAAESWQIGERCRQMGDLANAVQVLRRSNRFDPSEPRTYYSLAMICLEVNAVHAAGDFLKTGLLYAKEMPQLAALFLLQLGRLSYASGQYEEAKKLLEEAFAADPKNIDVWYEFALAAVKLQDTETAIYYLCNLLFAARKKNPAYVQKVLHDPEFKNILPSIL